MAERKRTRQSLGVVYEKETQKQGNNKEVAKISRKRNSKVVEHPHGHIDPDVFYEIRGILKETRDKYEIDWADGPEGEQYEPTWEPKGNVTELAKREWEVQKAKPCQDCCLTKPSLERQARPSALFDSHESEGVPDHEAVVLITADEDVYGDGSTEVAAMGKRRAVTKVVNHKLELFVSVQWEEAHLDSTGWEADISTDACTQKDQKAADATEVFSLYSIGKPDLARAGLNASKLQTSKVLLKERALEGRPQETATLLPFEAVDSAPSPSRSVDGGAAKASHVVPYNCPVPQPSGLEIPKTHYSTLARAKYMSAAAAITGNGMEASIEQDTTATPADHEAQLHQPQPNTLYANETADRSDESFHKPLAPGSMDPKGRAIETPSAIGDHGSSHISIPGIDFTGECPGFQASFLATRLIDCGSTPYPCTSGLSASKMYAPLPTLEPRVDIVRRVEKSWPFLPEPLDFAKAHGLLEGGVAKK